MSYTVFVRGGSARDASERVRVEPEQFGAFAIGERVELPVVVVARKNDYGDAVLRVTLEREYQHNAGVRAVPRPPAAAATG